MASRKPDPEAHDPRIAIPPHMAEVKPFDAAQAQAEIYGAKYGFIGRGYGLSAELSRPRRTQGKRKCPSKVAPKEAPLISREFDELLIDLDFD